jgi:predicted enzyme related to lactoylglutathione lyase
MRTSFTIQVAIGAVLGVLVSMPDIRAEEPLPQVSVGPQYESTHVYVAPQDFDRFVSSFIATFGGSKSGKAVLQITPTPSRTLWQAALTPAGMISVFAFETPIPYPFGVERTGYLVTDLDKAVTAARAAGADVFVSIFPDPIGRDAIIQWPGGVNMQLYWHKSPPSYAPLANVPENRVYVSALRADEFIRDFARFSHGKIVSDDRSAPGIEIGKPGTGYRRIRVESGFDKLVVLVSDGHLPWPYGRELMGYEVPDLTDALGRATGAGAIVLVQPFSSGGRESAMIQFPGGYIAEVHSANAANPH